MKRRVESLAEGTFDLLVVGGGIYGAWTAYDAALRGLRVALVERRDWASGTSSNSSKLIHGGLRYLEYRHFGLVRRTLAERNRLRVLGPHRVRRMRFAIPLYQGDRLLRWKMRAGLTLYDLLAGSRSPLRGHESLSTRRMGRRYGFLNTDKLHAGFTYGDCQTDDARFTLEIVDGALTAGAVAVNHAAVRELIVDDGVVRGASVEDRVNGSSIEVRARMTVLCAGAWNQRLLQGTVPGARLETRLSKGVHLILPALPTSDAFLLLTGERGRVVFMMPWNGRTLIGTTDTPYNGDPAAVRCTDEDETYLLAHVNRVLRGVQWTSANVIARFAGLRTFPRADGETASLSREWSLVAPCEGVLASIGGKYTSARADSAELVTRVCNALRREPGPCPTTWRDFPWKPEGRFRSWQRTTLSRGLQLGLDEETIHACQLRYGKRFEVLLRVVERMPQLARRFVAEFPVCLGELVYSSQYEMVGNLHDLLRRRIPLTLMTSLPRDRVEVAAAIAGKILRWSTERRDEEVRSVCGKAVAP